MNNSKTKSQIRPTIRIGKVSERMITNSQKMKRIRRGKEISSYALTICIWYICLPLMLMIEISLFSMNQEVHGIELAVKYILQLFAFPVLFMLFVSLKHVYWNNETVNVVNIINQETVFSLQQLSIVLAPDEPQQHLGMPFFPKVVVLRDSKNRHIVFGHIVFVTTLGFLALAAATVLRDFLEAVRNST